MTKAAARRFGLARLVHWTAAASRAQRAIVLAGLGVLAATGQAPLGWWPVSLAGFALALACLSASPTASPRHTFGAAFWFGVGYFGFALRWIVSPFLVDIATHGWMAPFALVLMAAGGALFWAIAGWAAQRLAAGSSLMLVLTLTTVEVARSLILTGFPWALPGQIWVDTPLAQSAAYVGPHGLSLLTLLIAWSLVAVARRRYIALAVPVLAAVAWVPLDPGAAPQYDGPVVRLVQPNAPQDQKWDPVHRAGFFERKLDLTAAAPRPDLVVWPETAITNLLDYSIVDLQAASEAAQGVPLVTGVNRHDGARYFNSLIVLGQGAEVQAIYDKAHIVPFGEYIPGGEWLERFGIRGLAASQGGGFTAGGVQPLVDLPGIGPARALICYEGIFAEEIGVADRPRLLLLITNDAWFGRGAGPYQHLAQARLRAIERGLPMVRVANTGVSAMIDARGRITGQIALNTAGSLDLPLPPALSPTPYARFGDAPILALLALALLACATRGARLSD